MYCIKCGVKLEDSEKKCPLCETVVYHPDVRQGKADELYPNGKMPRSASGRAFVCGAVVFLFLIPIITTFFSDYHLDARLTWFGYVTGGIILSYIVVALPMWFKNPNPVVFVPCDFLACALYLLYINIAVGGNWFLTLALPIVVGVAIITCTLVTLLKYLRKGRLYAIGGAVMALGGLILMIEFLMDFTFDMKFSGWSFYPAVTLFLIGGMLIYLALNSEAREKIERKFFF